jgi:hypothetical protein
MAVPVVPGNGSNSEATTSVQVQPQTQGRLVFDRDAMQNGIKTILNYDYKLNVNSVSCPADQPVALAATFACVVQIDGAYKNVIIKVISTNGEYEVGQPR